MDMLSLCRKRAASTSPKSERRSRRIAEPNKLNTPAINDDKRFSNLDVFKMPAISQNLSGNIILRILAKPGAKQSGITDIAEEFVGVKVGASAEDGEANVELVKYLASILQVKKTNVIVEKGSRSQIKSVLVNKNGLTIGQVKDLIGQELCKVPESDSD